MSRRGLDFRAGIAAACLAVLATLALGPLAGSAAATGQPGARQLVGITPATDLSFGEYKQMYYGKVPTLRLPFFWEDIEPTPGGFDWAKEDQAVAYAAAAGMRIRPFIMGVPDWVQQGSNSNHYPPVNSAFFKRNWKYLLSSLIKRYGPHGQLWTYLASVAPSLRAQPIRTW